MQAGITGVPEESVSVVGLRLEDWLTDVDGEVAEKDDHGASRYWRRRVIIVPIVVDKLQDAVVVL